jgi:ribosomal RNA assembly protein
MRYVRIPQDRIGVLIGPQGKTKEHIENRCNISLQIDSDLGEIRFDEQHIEDPLMIFKVEHIIRAIGRGFSPQHAFALFRDDMDFYSFDIHDYVGKKKSHVRRVKSRVIGRKGKTKRILEEITDSYISIYGHTISIIGHIEDIDITKKAIDKLLSGSKHATVYRFVEQSMKNLRLHHGF